MAPLASSAVSTTMLLTLPPKAASMARSQAFSGEMRSPAGPMMPPIPSSFFRLACITARTPAAKPS